MPYLEVILRSTTIYIFIIIAIRIFGKREITQLSIIDLVFILLISNSVQNAMIGDNTSLQVGLLAAVTLFILNRILSLVLSRSKKATHILEGDPLMLVYHGKAIYKHLAKAEITHDELEEVIREHGVNDISKVDLAVLERDGNISVLSQNFHHHTNRKRKGHKVIERES